MKNFLMLATFVITTISVSFANVTYPIVGTVLNNGNQIEWVSSSNTDVNFFIVQRSIDGVQFSPIAMVTIQENVEYAFEDKQAEGMNAYYRVVTVDNQGVGEYSNVVNLNRDFVTSCVPPTNIVINDHIIDEMNQWLTELEFPMLTKLGVVANFSSEEE